MTVTAMATSYTIHPTERGPILEWDGIYHANDDMRHKKYYAAKLTFQFHSFVRKSNSELYWPGVASFVKKAFPNLPSSLKVEANTFSGWIGSGGPDEYLHKESVQTAITFTIRYAKRKDLPQNCLKAFEDLRPGLGLIDEKEIRRRCLDAIKEALQERIDEVEAENRCYRANTLVIGLANAATEAAKEICRFEQKLAALVAEVEEERKLQANKIRQKAEMNNEYLKSHHPKVKEAALKHIEEAFQPVIHDYGFGETKTPITRDEVK